MRKFMDEDFLLESESAKRLYHGFVEHLPLFDYHCHLPVKEIYENKSFDNLGSLWLAHDHYKWRMMRCCGLPERLISGDAPWYDKFQAFAKALPYAIGNPIYHWTHLELKRYFGIDEVLNGETADKIWEESCRLLADGTYSPRYFIEESKLDTVCTTDDPADSLKYHKLLAESDFKTRVVPAFRPDKAFKIEDPCYADYIRTLSETSNTAIVDFESLVAALEKRIADFNEAGCFACDHDLSRVYCRPGTAEEAGRIFAKAVSGSTLSVEECDLFKTVLLTRLCKSYCKMGWAMELHVGCERSVNRLGVQNVGRSSGFDSPGDLEIAQPLGGLLNELNMKRILPKTILFCMNPKDNWVIASLSTTFQEEGIPGKIQFGTAWWMQDHIPGMLAQMEALAHTGVFGHFIGMLTDSRSYLSYTRFEYFRRILCNYLADFAERGQYPADLDALGQLAANISFYNAKNYFARTNQ